MTTEGNISLLSVLIGSIAAGVAFGPAAGIAAFFLVAPMVPRFRNHPFRRHPMFMRFVLVRLRQMQSRGFQMAIGEVQAHLAAFGDGEGFG